MFTVATLIGFFGGMARGPMSLVAPISATGVSIPVLVGIAGGERPSLLQLVGIARPAPASSSRPGSPATPMRSG